MENRRKQSAHFFFFFWNLVYMYVTDNTKKGPCGNCERCRPKSACYWQIFCVSNDNSTLLNCHFEVINWHQPILASFPLFFFSFLSSRSSDKVPFHMTGHICIYMCCIGEYLMFSRGQCRSILNKNAVLSFICWNQQFKPNSVKSIEHHGTGRISMSGYKPTSRFCCNFSNHFYMNIIIIITFNSQCKSRYN